MALLQFTNMGFKAVFFEHLSLSSSREVCYRGALNDAFTRSNELVIGSLSPSWP
jgi:hypothetical protein